MTNSGPHQSDMGKRELRQMLTAIFRASGHVSGGPSSVSDQDFARMSAPISPPSARKWGMAIMPRPSLAESFTRDLFGHKRQQDRRRVSVASVLAPVED